ncbi:hypothetical protein CI109_102035 [Kwoniella shandongensis]|uniref:Major facilitator superfamily (MFS) profile domain-containing protein n=1 Tax=Kwoniella shandongensis TaxID=1734106 RepID=A0AAJ8LI87_9TREE
MSLYAPEIFNYRMRANGTAVEKYANAIPALVLVYVMPIGLAKLGWKMYMINASWNIITFGLIAMFWVETKGLSLEEIDELFDEPKVREGLDPLTGADAVVYDQEDQKHSAVDVNVNEVR